MEALAISALYVTSAYQGLRLRPLVEPWLRSNSTTLLYKASMAVADTQHHVSSELTTAHVAALALITVLFVTTTLARGRIKSAAVASVLLGINIVIGYAHVQSLRPFICNSPVPYYVIAFCHTTLLSWMIQDVRIVAADTSPEWLLWSCSLSCLGVVDFGILHLLGIVKMTELCHQLFGSRM